MPSPHTIERQRGAKEASQQLGVLRERWPLAFPVRAQDVRPLAMGTVGRIAEAMGWTIPYTMGVLTYWKHRPRPMPLPAEIAPVPGTRAAERAKSTKMAERAKPVVKKKVVHFAHRRSFHGDYAQYDTWGWPGSGWGGWGGGYRF
jgi:hypothetical protein